MRYYLRDQLIFSLLIFLGLAIAMHFYQTHKKIEQENKIFRQQIVNVFCTSRNVGSEIEIKFSKKVYKVNVPNNQCSHLKNGSYIDLLYNKNFDYFFITGKSKSNLLQIYILSAAFIISLLPWRKWF